MGLYDAATSVFYLKYRTTTGMADAVFGYGVPGAGWKPLAGNWTGGSALVAADGPVAASDAGSLNQADLKPIVAEAIARWADAGLDAASLGKLARVEFAIGDLSGSLLGLAAGNRVWLDRDAAGHGWFIDPTPAADEEFAPSGTGSQLTALDPRAVDQIDLQTVVAHELGHIAGFADLDAQGESLMSRALGTGVRRSPARES